MRHQQTTLMARCNELTIATWCVVEYQVMFSEGPPTLMMITSCRLDQAFHMRHPLNNSVWREHVRPEHPVIVNIHAIGTKVECNKLASKLTIERNPRCIIGQDSRYNRKRIQADDGRIFDTQQDVADAIGASQAAVSLHLRGGTRAVRGVVLTYVE